MRIAVFAPEGCGNALSKILLRSCGFSDIGGASLPFERAGKACRYETCHGMGLWPVVCDARKYDAFLLVTRSPVHSTYSAYCRLAYREWNPGGYWTRGYTREGVIETIIWQQLAARCMVDMLNLLDDPPHSWISYGHLVNAPRSALRTIFNEWGVEHREMSEPVDIRHRNDNRWQEDRLFAKTWEKYKCLFKN